MIVGMLDLKSTNYIEQLESNSYL